MTAAKRQIPPAPFGAEARKRWEADRDEERRQDEHATAINDAERAVIEAAIEERRTFQECSGPGFNAERYEVWQRAGSAYAEAVSALLALRAAPLPAITEQRREEVGG